jgi:endopeptidase La
MNVKKAVKNKTVIKKTDDEIQILIKNKVCFFQEVIQKTILYLQKNKVYNIISIGEMNTSINLLISLGNQLQNISEETIKNQTNNIVNVLQIVNNELSTLFKDFGTENIEDLLSICFGTNLVNTFITNNVDKERLELLKKYFHPTGYKTHLTKNCKKTLKNDINDKVKNLDILDINIKTTSFYLKIYGVQIIVYNSEQDKSIIISGFIDNVIVDCLNNKYIKLKIQNIKENIPKSKEFVEEEFANFMNTLILKDYLVSEPQEIYMKYIGYQSNINSLLQKQLTNIVKDFMTSDLFVKRNLIIQLLIKTEKYDNQYLAYLLYDLLSTDTNGTIDTHEQTMLLDSFPWFIKQNFKTAMKNTIQYTNELSNFDINKIPLEQQICLLKTTDLVKEKAMQKLKEVKSKTDDSVSKARQYLDGLLKIPFGIYKKEPILNIMNDIKKQFINMVKLYDLPNIQIKDSYTNLEILLAIKMLQTNKICNVEKYLNSLSLKELKNTAIKINENMKNVKLKINGINMNERKDEILKINNEELSKYLNIEPNNLLVCANNISQKYEEINKSINNIKLVLDDSIYGHTKAKKQIERIIGQWINGKQDGYCFGFEGPPGVGKTSLAKKGLSNCLKDEQGVSRPFGMIQIGGDSNGSSLHGHNYTYVGSSWGSIVQILIDKKCMNPIIFIDEIDKISKTEQGKEIVGILTHLLDPSQNDCFQDKYFSGIDLDLSKVLFILSYNDVDAIDKILLDRVHRIQFKNLTLDEKIIISNKHILPEIYEKMGLENMIHFSDEVLKFIIDEYTLEPGVRKLKEILFEIIGEINLNILKNIDMQYSIPITITIEDIKTVYFKDKCEIKHKKIHTENKIGIINGLWANAQGQGGVIPIQTNWRPCSKFLELFLTGLQGDVMKESMNVALTLAWNLTSAERKSELSLECNGIHIHCPEGAIPKDGPSAGTAITTTIYSLINNKKIKYNVAITGEITLCGKVTEIGGLDLKFIGGIKSGVTEFLFPKDNYKDYEKFMEKYKTDKLTNGIKFTAVETIEEVFELVFE